MLCLCIGYLNKGLPYLGSHYMLYEAVALFSQITIQYYVTFPGKICCSIRDGKHWSFG